MVELTVSTNMPKEIYSDYCSAVEEVTSSMPCDLEMILTDDFNTPGINWNDTASACSNQSSNALHNVASMFNLPQFNSTFSFRGVNLDLIFSSLPSTC